MEITTFGRPLMMWEKDVTAFVQRGRGRITKGIMRQLYKLSDEEFRQVARVCDPRFDKIEYLHAGQMGQPGEFTILSHGKTTTYSF